jgi:DNA invertase Pin-like site-specific DNA recombinase
LGRDLRDLLDLSATLSSRKIELQSVMDKIDTSSAIGRLYFQMMESLAEFERAGGIERTKAGLAAARVRGVVMGRPSKIKPEQWIEAKALLSEGKAAPTVAKLLGITRQAIYRRLAIERGESTPPEQKPQFSAAPTRGGSHRNAPRETPA